MTSPGRIQDHGRTRTQMRIVERLGPSGVTGIDQEYQSEDLVVVGVDIIQGGGEGREGQTAGDQVDNGTALPSTIPQSDQHDTGNFD